MAESFWFGDEVQNLWLKYVNGNAKGTREVFNSSSSEIVEDFRQSSIIKSEEEEILNTAAVKITPSDYPTNMWVRRPVNNLLMTTERRINFNNFTQIPGHIAGGVSSSDEFGKDRREVSGGVLIQQQTDGQGNTNGVRLKSDFDWVIKDTLDFCPGNCATGGIEEHVTVPLSRLEAMNIATPVGFRVEFKGPTVDRTFH